MIIQTVNSENGGKEGLWIAFFCAVILLLGWLLLPYNQAISKQTEVASHQVSIKDLGSKPLAMIADLRLAHEEIHHLYQVTGHWSSIAQLEQTWISPFVKDKSWSHQGEHQWVLVAPGLYQGTSKVGGVRYILNSSQTEVDIWLDVQEQATLAAIQTQPLSISQLIQLGWTQVDFQTETQPAHNNH